ncbi:guanine deaminase [Devosia neptuniae]|jgi:guanine deaminase|uniref:guanine deaminase n=1 Tax=Devosia TaxID=46913 RepID=UPI0022AF9547|nr:guanine deaminase [Devosia neptuniae]MCZ4347187.1 guanine deaminase [Devosia neptuniae]|tara:strand:- start:16018 stop:17319 length:1302 start_codon:yes stop_codon:yes gene_type:complete
MSVTILRGRVLSFLSEPQGLDDTASYRYLEDGAISIVDGKIVAVEDFDSAAVGDAVVIDHRPHLIMPGFIDTHLHYVQSQMIASYAGSLLEWLNTYTFVEEQKFSQQGHASAVASAFYDELIRQGTTTAVAYCSSAPASVDAYFAEAEKRNMLMVGGKVMMDRNAPEALCDTAQSSYDDTRTLIARWHGRGRGLYAISPRFAITSTPEQMAAAQSLVAEHPECYVQTHLSENDAEITLSMQLYPDAPDYTGIYQDYGLLGPKTLLGHCIHLNHRETGVLAETSSVAVFCPTSNLFLGSGLFDHQRLSQHGVRIGVATDIGGGTSFSMLRTLDEGYKILQLRGQRLTPFNSFYMMTLGNARALSLEGTIGTIAPGCSADLVVLDSAATPAMALRMQTATQLVEELFLLQTLGDDRAIAEVYVAGAQAKSTIGGL